MLSKKEYNYYIRQIHNYLNHGHRITFKKMRKFAGSIDYENENKPNIEIDHRQNFLSTLVHEICHHINPEKNERWILQQEKKIMNKMTSRQARNITKKLIKNSIAK